jgi:hypothetical protein
MKTRTPFFLATLGAAIVAVVSMAHALAVTLAAGG